MAVVVFKGHNCKCDLQQDIMLYHVSWLVYFSLSAHMQKIESKVNIAGIAQHGINSVFGLNPMLSKFHDSKISSISQSHVYVS